MIGVGLAVRRFRRERTAGVQQFGGVGNRERGQGRRGSDGAEQNVDLFFLKSAHDRWLLGRRAFVVSFDDFDLTAENTAGGVDFIDGDARADIERRVG